MCLLHLKFKVLKFAIVLRQMAVPFGFEMLRKLLLLVMRGVTTISLLDGLQVVKAVLDGVMKLDGGFPISIRERRIMLHQSRVVVEPTGTPNGWVVLRILSS